MGRVTKFAVTAVFLLTNIVAPMSPFFTRLVRAEAGPADLSSFPMEEMPVNMVRGQDGNLWIWSYRQGGSRENVIQRMTPSGATTVYQLPSELAFSNDTFVPINLAAGTDGNVWMTVAGKIAKMSQAGQTTAYNLPTPASRAHNITMDSGGNLWFAYVPNSSALPYGYGKMTPTGDFTLYPFQNRGPWANSILQGSDGNIWIGINGAIGKIAPTTGEILEWYGVSGGGTIHLTKGPDNGIWFAEQSGDKIGKITPAGAITEYDLPPSGPNGYIVQPTDIIAGPDGNLWYISATESRLYRMTTSGVVTEFDVNGHFPTGYSQALAVGSDNNLWYTGYAEMLRLNLHITPPDDTGDSSFRPNEDGLGFDNYGVGSDFYKELSADAFVQFFGEDETQTDDGKLLPRAKAYYEEQYRDLAEGGFCFGFSGVTALNFLGLSQQNAGSFAMPGGTNYYGITNPLQFFGTGTPTRDLSEALGYYAGVQKGQDAISDILNRDTPNNMLTTIQQSLSSDTPMQVAIQKSVNLTKGTTTIGHSLLAYRYEQHGTTTDVYVYDSNHAGDNTKKLGFNTQDNAWSYNPNDATGVWSSNAPGGVLSLMPVVDYTKEGILPNEAQTHSIWFPYGMTGNIATQDGKRLGINNGEFVSQIPGANVLPDFVAPANDDPDQTFIVPSGAPYTISAANTGEATPISVFSNNAYVSVTGLTPAVGDTAVVTLGQNGKSVTVSSSAAVEDVTLKLDQEVTGRGLVFTVSGISLQPGEQTTFSLNDNDGKLSVRNHGTTPKSYSVAMQEVGGNDSELAVDNAVVDPNATEQWVPSDWSNLTGEPVRVITDANSDGTPDSTEVVNPPSETGSVRINDGGQYAADRKVVLHITAPAGAVQMRIANGPASKLQNATWRTLDNELQWTLPSGNGTKTVYVQFRTASGQASEAYSARVTLDTQTPMITKLLVNGGLPVTTKTNVRLELLAKDNLSGVTQMRIANTSAISNAPWQPYQEKFNWNLGSLPSRPTVRFIYAQVMDGAGNVSKVWQMPVVILPGR